VTATAAGIGRAYAALPPPPHRRVAEHVRPHLAAGAVWSASSIAYCGALSFNSYDNNISRLTRNVLDRFLRDEPVPVGATASVG